MWLIPWGLPLLLRFWIAPLFSALFSSFSASFRSRAALQLEILALRHQVGVLQRSVKRPQLTPADRFLWAGRRVEGLAIQCLLRQAIDGHWLAPEGLPFIL